MSTRFILCGTVLACIACDAGSSTPPDLASSEGQHVPDSLAAAYTDYFPIGTAIGPAHISTVGEIITHEFNHLTAENDMKARLIQPDEGTFNFTNADKIADLARANSMTMTGHALLWHREVPNWMFAGLTPGDRDDIETLKSRLQAHINGLVPRYADVVDNWDVVNEAISDDASKVYRDGSEGSRWYDLFGSEEYVYWAFKYAYEALEAHEVGSAAGRLYYNDYNVNLKVDRIVPMLDAIRERGVPVDGVGLQAHVRMDWPSIEELQQTIDKLVAAGYQLKISELDMTVYNDYPLGTLEPAPERPFDSALENQQAAAYGSLFELFRHNRDVITSVTLWGVSDDMTWLDSTPVGGRDNYPLLWNDEHEPKKAYFAVREF